MTLPAGFAGPHYLIVRTDSHTELFEGSATANNAAAAPTAPDAGVTTLTLGTTANGLFSGASETDFYRVTVTAGHSLRVTLDSLAASGATELYIRRGALPSRTDYDFRAVMASYRFTGGGNSPSMSSMQKSCSACVIGRSCTAPKFPVDL